MHIDECLKIPSMARKWRSFRPDTKITLSHAFEHAIRNPKLVAEYSCRTFTLCCGYSCGIHRMRTGYSAFVLAEIIDLPIILVDAELRDGRPVFSR